MNVINIAGTILVIVLLLSGCTKDIHPEVYPVDEDVILKDVAYGDHEQPIGNL